MNIIKRLEALENKHKPLQIKMFCHLSDIELEAEKAKLDPETIIINIVSPEVLG